jgi:hypothetical protein
MTLLVAFEESLRRLSSVLLVALPTSLSLHLLSQVDLLFVIVAFVVVVSSMCLLPLLVDSVFPSLSRFAFLCVTLCCCLWCESPDACECYVFLHVWLVLSCYAIPSR